MSEPLFVCAYAGEGNPPPLLPGELMNLARDIRDDLIEAEGWTVEQVAAAFLAVAEEALTAAVEARAQKADCGAAGARTAPFRDGG